MEPLAWIIVSGLLMSCIALVGSLTLLLTEDTLRKLLLPLVALSAGSLLGGAFFHMLPASLETMGVQISVFVWILIGFSVFFMLEQFLHWHHCHKASAECRQPLTYLILLGDGLHNFIGGLAVAGTFLIDIHLGITTWLAAAAHEIPQELGDFGVLLHGGWSKWNALLFNFLSGFTFLIGGLVAYWVSYAMDTSFLVPFAAGNFIYIAASDLVPEVNRHEHLAGNLVNLGFFVSGILLLLLIKTGV
jgi:zinc and cadmium transporter